MWRDQTLGTMVQAAFAVLFTVASLQSAVVAVPQSSREVKQLFPEPPREYSSAPLWVWNDMLTDEQIVSTLEDLASQHVKQVFVHPRPGLMTPYLSDEWFRLWKLALKTAERLDMNVWIYDENSYPSGFAGGWVPELMPESVGRGLSVKQVKRFQDIDPDAVAVFRVEGERYENVTSSIQDKKSLPDGQYLVFSLVRAAPSPWHGGRAYVDLLYPGVTEKFLEVTLEAYRREVGDAFGQRIPGSFTDEPRLLSAGQLTWTEDFAEQFQERFAYNLVDHLPALVQSVGDWKRVRHDYYRLLLDLFVERWARPYSEWCEKHGLEFTGHYWEHEWPLCRFVPDNMAMYAWHQRPAIDCLMNQYAEHTHAQFGNIRAVRELSSAADQCGRTRTLCELYGAGGWDLRFQDMKRIADWLGVLGVNTFDEHLSYVTIRGARKMDHPQSFSYHEPWWSSYHVLADYLTRLSLVLSSGQHVNEILVLEPTSTAWLYQVDRATSSHLEQLGENFFNLVKSLEFGQIEYELGCEHIMANLGKVQDGYLVVGKRKYHTVVLPQTCENLEKTTLDLLRQFLLAGGTVLVCGDGPRLVDGRPSEALQECRDLPGWKKVDENELPKLLAPRQDQAVRIVQQEDRRGLLLHQRRRLKDGEILFLVNTSDSEHAAGTIHAQYLGAEVWDLETGEMRPASFSPKGDAIELTFDLPPIGSLVLFLSHRANTPAHEASTTEEEIALGPIHAERLDPNVLTLDYFDVKIQDEVRQGMYFVPACNWIFQKHGLPGNPWDRAVQFRDEIIRRQFPPDSGFELTYHFEIKEKVSDQIWFVLERPDIYTVTCNGKPVPSPSGWWLDRSFGKIDITKLVKVGENVVTATASPMTMFHEAAAAYVLGDFSVTPVEKGFVITPPQDIHVGEGWNAQGCPFYPGRVAYRTRVHKSRGDGRWLVRLGAWNGSLAQVLVNGAPAGVIYRPPYECEITTLLKEGDNEITVIVTGTLKNTLGPHHAGPIRGSAWPHAFAQGPTEGPPPGTAYDTIAYGLFEPFRVIHQKVEESR